ncbi:MAG TPA: archaellar assembly protein FlaJ [Halobacteria archaeon]|nr:archaellar assembly protein FlaJ [Halobacteria archaeon]
MDFNEKHTEDRTYVPSHKDEEESRYSNYNVVNKAKGFINRIKEWYYEKYSRNDLLYMLTYMTSISTANLTRDEIFKRTGNKKEYYTSKHIKYIARIVQDWNYDYATACEIESKNTKDETIKRTLERLGNAIKAGEPDEEFLTSELDTIQILTKDKYENDIETLKKAMDAFTSLIIATSVISIIMLLAASLYASTSINMALYLSVILEALISGFVIFLLFDAAPKEFKIHPLPIKSDEQNFIFKWQKVLVPLAFIALIISFILLPRIQAIAPLLTDFPYLTESIGFISFGVLVLPLGLMAIRDDRKINRRDMEFTAFIRGLGRIMGSTGQSISNSLSKVDKKSLPTIKDSIIRLENRIKLGLDMDISWNRFIGESGSNIFYKFAGIFLDAIRLGGKPDRVGDLVATSSLESVLLRSSKEIESNQFVILTIPLHIAMLLTFIAISQILLNLAGIIAGVSGMTAGLNTTFGLFTGLSETLLHNYVIAITFILTISSIVACKVSKGGNLYDYYIFSSIFFIVAGVSLLLIPYALSSILPTFSLPVSPGLGGF